LGRFGLPDTIGEDPNVTLILAPQDSAAVPVKRPKSEPKVHLPLTITFAGPRSRAGGAQGYRRVLDHGTAIMRLALWRCFADPAAAAVLLDPLVANKNAQRFYERLGFTRVERRMFGNDDCYVYRHGRTEWSAAQPFEQ
jgi:GNAT acetyltransferase-like protein